MNEVTEIKNETVRLNSDTKAVLAFESDKKSVGAAYLLWFFFSWIGAHRFYLGRTGGGIGMLILFAISTVLSVVGVGVLGYLALGIWALVDAFIIPGIAREYNHALIGRIENGLGDHI